MIAVAISMTGLALVLMLGASSHELTKALNRLAAAVESQKPLPDAKEPR